jgi:hypothetical protein
VPGPIEVQNTPQLAEFGERSGQPGLSDAFGFTAEVVGAENAQRLVYMLSSIRSARACSANMETHYLPCLLFNTGSL